MVSIQNYYLIISSKEERKALPALTEYLHRKQEKYLIESHESPGLEFTITLAKIKKNIH